MLAKALVSIELAGKNQVMALQGMIGKKVTLDAPMLAGKGGAGKWLALKTVPGMGSKAAAGSVVAKGAAVTKGATAAKGAAAMKGIATAKTVAAPQMILAAKTTATTIGAKGAAAAGAAAGAAKGAAVGGTIWSGTGMSLGLGLGLGAMGPAILGGLAAFTGYRYFKRRQEQLATDTDTEIENTIPETKA